MATAIQEAALRRAEDNSSVANEVSVIEQFVDRGLDADDVLPRVNVLTYNAWRAKGRQVRRGERGVRITTWIPVERKTPSGKVKDGVRPKSASVFHVSQTDPANN